MYSPISTGPLAGVLQFMDERDRVARRPFCVTRGKRPIVGRLPVQTSHNGTLPTFCVPLWVACARPTPSPPTPRPSSHVDTNQPAGHRSPRSFLAGLLQFLVQVSETNGVPSFSTTQKDPTVGRSQVLASHSGTNRHTHSRKRLTVRRLNRLARQGPRRWTPDRAKRLPGRRPSSDGRSRGRGPSRGHSPGSRP